MDQLVNNPQKITLAFRILKWSKTQILRKPTIQILEPFNKTLFLERDKEETNKTIKGRVHNCKPDSVVWLVGLLKNAKENERNSVFPHNESHIIPNPDGTWEGKVFFKKDDDVIFYAVVMPMSSTLDLIFQYFYKAEIHYNQHSSKKRNFLGFDSRILKEYDLKEYVTVIS